jgi:alkaline phosphatase D
MKKELVNPNFLKKNLSMCKVRLVRGTQIIALLLILNLVQPTISKAPGTITHGPIVGAVTENSAKVFVRTNQAAGISVRFGTNSDLSGASETATFHTYSSSDLTTQVPLGSLAPSTTYYLNVLVNGVSQLGVPYPHFKTFPAAGSNVPFKVVVLTDFSNADSRSIPSTTTFIQAAGENPDFVFIGGDFDHTTPSGATEGEARQNKRLMFRNLYGANMQGFVDNILYQYAVVHQWDDHDYGDNNANKESLWKQVSFEVFKEYFPAYPVTQYGIWQKFRYGQAEFFVLDTRSQRDPNRQKDSPAESMLDGDNLGSEGQLEWLKNGLLSSTATWKFVMTSVVWNPTTAKADAWSSFQNERNQLLSFINNNNIRRVIFVSGDSHFGGIDDGTYAGKPEMLVPSVNLASPHGGSCVDGKAESMGTWSVGTYGNPGWSECQGYGVITVGTNPDSLTLEVKDKDGNTKIRWDMFVHDDGDVVDAFDFRYRILL